MTGADDEQARRERAKRLRRQIDELRSGAKDEPRTPREFLEEKAREERKHQESEDGETEEEAEED